MSANSPIRLDEKNAFVWQSGMVDAQGANTIIAGAAGTQIIVQTLILFNEEAQTTVTAIWQNGAGGEGPRLHLLSEGDNLAIYHPEGKPWRLTPGNALVLDLSAAAEVGYSVYYKIVH